MIKCLKSYIRSTPEYDQMLEKLHLKYASKTGTPEHDQMLKEMRGKYADKVG